MIDARAAFVERYNFTAGRLRDFVTGFQGQLSKTLTTLDPATCIYVTGSAGRGELSPYSDLDLFFICDGDASAGLDPAVRQAVELALADHGFPAPSNEGEFLVLHSVDDMVQHMGTRDDDARNLFTARILLLLESRCIANEQTYDSAVDRILRAYWRHSATYPSSYLPIVLLNDICRYWRIVLLNYEAKQNPGRDPDVIGEALEIAKAKRRLLSHKLRFSRCLLCYSAIAYLLAEAKTGHVSLESARRMTQLTPIQRIEAVTSAGDDQTSCLGNTLLDEYRAFLSRMNREKAQLVAEFRDFETKRTRLLEGDRFGANMAALMQHLGKDNPLFRFLLV